MPHFSKRSLSRLDTCHPDLQRVMHEVIKHWDCTILEGFRNQVTQDEYVRIGTSTLMWPEGKHNRTPSEAVDVAPYPIDWENKGRFYYFSGFVLGIAQSMGIRLRHGGDWDGDRDIHDQNLHDLPHFERVDATPEGVIEV